MNKLIFLFAFLLICTLTFAQNQSTALALPTADSTNFSVNYQAGWQLYSAYVSMEKTDSITLEIIVQHNRDIDLTREQRVGRIKPTNMMPLNGQILSFNLMYDTYQLHVGTDGECYLRLTSGSLPEGDPIVIPVRVTYKRR